MTAGRVTDKTWQILTELKTIIFVTLRNRNFAIKTLPRITPFLYACLLQLQILSNRLHLHFKLFLTIGFRSYSISFRLTLLSDRFSRRSPAPLRLLHGPLLNKSGSALGSDFSGPDEYSIVYFPLPALFFRSRVACFWGPRPSSRSLFRHIAFTSPTVLLPSSCHIDA